MTKIDIDWSRCDGHLVCAELLPELVHPDDWGFPVVPVGPVPPALVRHARRARADCPRQALRLRAPEPEEWTA